MTTVYSEVHNYKKTLLSNITKCLLHSEKQVWKILEISKQQHVLHAEDILQLENESENSKLHVRGYILQQKYWNLTYQCSVKLENRLSKIQLEIAVWKMGKWKRISNAYFYHTLATPVNIWFLCKINFDMVMKFWACLFDYSMFILLNNKL